MKIFTLPIIALAAAVLTGCSFGATNDQPVTAAPAPVTTTPEPAPAAMATAAPAAAKPKEIAQTIGPHIDASAFLNALVESGCQIDKAEYKEVKRGGAIKIVCSKKVDPLNVELEDL